jgi:hypothetical protein
VGDEEMVTGQRAYFEKLVVSFMYTATDSFYTDPMIGIHSLVDIAK